MYFTGGALPVWNKTCLTLKIGENKMTLTQILLSALCGSIVLAVLFFVAMVQFRRIGPQKSETFYTPSAWRKDE